MRRVSLVSLMGFSRVSAPSAPPGSPPVGANIIAEQAATETMRADSVERVSIKDLLNDLRCTNSTVSPCAEGG